jgi:hypothetical protein
MSVSVLGGDIYRYILGELQNRNMFHGYNHASAEVRGLVLNMMFYVDTCNELLDKIKCNKILEVFILCRVGVH